MTALVVLLLAWLLGLAVLSAVVAIEMAEVRGRSTTAWGWLAFLYGVPAVLLLHVLPDNVAVARSRRVDEPPGQGAAATPGDPLLDDRPDDDPGLTKIKAALAAGATTATVRRMAARLRARGEIALTEETLESMITASAEKYRAGREG